MRTLKILLGTVGIANLLNAAFFFAAGHQAAAWLNVWSSALQWLFLLLLDRRMVLPDRGEARSE